MTLDSVANFVNVQASTGYSSAAMAIALQSGQGSRLPAAPFNLTWWNSTNYPNPANDPSVEIVRVTAISGDTITISRAQEGTAAANHNVAGKTYSLVLGITAKMIADIAAQTLNGIPVFNEIVSGSGTTFTLAHALVTGSVRLYAEGEGRRAAFSEAECAREQVMALVALRRSAGIPAIHRHRPREGRRQRVNDAR